MGNRGAEDSSDKLQRKLAKVERKRKQLRWLCTVQVLLAVPYGVYVLTPPWKPEDASTGQGERSVIVYYQVHANSHPSTAITRPHTDSQAHLASVCTQATLALLWALVGLLGLFAATVRRLQSVREGASRPNPPPPLRPPSPTPDPRPPTRLPI